MTLVLQNLNEKRIYLINNNSADRENIRFQIHYVEDTSAVLKHSVYFFFLYNHILYCIIIKFM